MDTLAAHAGPQLLLQVAKLFVGQRVCAGHLGGRLAAMAGGELAGRRA